ncbi:MAG: HD domain-containing protein [Clostridia bacterium]|nr:HD domain-containing protein [Clostridia bacterium]
MSFSKNPEFDFYDKTSLKSYNLDKSMQYQLNMLDSLDVFTRKHCENVASITCRLCEYLHLPKDFTAYCTICAYLHDIGKQFIPPSILQKPGKLTDEEYEIMKTHTTIGYEMCMKDLKLRPYAAGPYYHHEALDGSGYPQGLKKNDIPYEAQIIRVADEYDAIVSKRQYKSHIGISDTLKILIENAHPRKPINPSDALNEIANNAKLGKNNPKVVKCLIKVVINDIEYEISGKQEYLDYIKSELKRLTEIEKYKTKMNNSKKEKDKNYYLEGIKMLLQQGETLENVDQVYNELQDAYDFRKKEIEHLWDEIKVIKKLKV